MAIFTSGVAVLQAENPSYDESQILHAWEWVRTAKHAEEAPVRQIAAGTGIWKDYHPEYKAPALAYPLVRRYWLRYRCSTRSPS